jgi:hypothetical protein
MTFSTYLSPGVAIQGGSSSGGGGAASAPLTGTGATITTSQPLIDVSQTWNNAAVTFTSAKINVTNTASAAASLLLDLQLGSVSQFNIDKTGVVNFAAGSKTAPTIKFSGFAGGLYGRVGGFVTFSNGSVEMASIGSAGGAFCNQIGLAASGADLSATGTDLVLARDASNTLALRNGVNAQTFNLYQTYTDASNYSRLQISYGGFTSAFSIFPQRAGTGTTQDLIIGGNKEIFFYISGYIWKYSSAGHYLAQTDNTYDIGASGANRPRSIYAGTSITPGAGVAVASLPTPSTGMVARVTNALAPAIGAAVAGGGAAQALVWYNGANWTVIGV